MADKRAVISTVGGWRQRALFPRPEMRRLTWHRNAVRRLKLKRQKEREVGLRQPRLPLSD